VVRATAMVAAKAVAEMVEMERAAVTVEQVARVDRSW